MRIQFQYSGTLLIYGHQYIFNRPKKKLAVLTRIFFYKKMYGGFYQAAKKVAVIAR